MITEFIALKIDGLPHVKQRMLLSFVVLESYTELIRYWEVKFYLQVSNKTTGREHLSCTEKF